MRPRKRAVLIGALQGHSDGVRNRETEGGRKPRNKYSPCIQGGASWMSNDPTAAFHYLRLLLKMDLPKRAYQNHG